MGAALLHTPAAMTMRRYVLERRHDAMAAAALEPVRPPRVRVEFTVCCAEVPFRAASWKAPNEEKEP